MNVITNINLRYQVLTQFRIVLEPGTLHLYRLQRMQLAVDRLNQHQIPAA